MKTKTYKHGNFTYKSYVKAAGSGYEVGFKQGNKSLFYGNFLHVKEANAWYSMMNSEIEKFSKKYWVTPKSPKTFYNKFITNHLYKTYYSYLDKQFTRYNRMFKTAFTKNERKYKQLKKTWDSTEKMYFKRAA